MNDDEPIECDPVTVETDQNATDVDDHNYCGIMLWEEDPRWHKPYRPQDQPLVDRLCAAKAAGYAWACLLCGNGLDEENQPHDCTEEFAHDYNL